MTGEATTVDAASAHRNRRSTWLVVSVLLAAASGCPKQPDVATTTEAPPATTSRGAVLADGLYRAEVGLPGGLLPFLLTVTGPRVEIDAGGEHVAVTAEQKAASVVLSSPQYDARLVIQRGQNGLVGTYEKRRKSGWVSMPLTLTQVPAGSTAFPTPHAAPAQPLAARHRMVFSSSPDAPALGLFTTHENAVVGTILTDTGDYRHLYGTWDGKTLTLAAFDFAHAFLFRARKDNTGRLHGDFWSGDHWHENFEGFADDAFVLDDGFGLAKVKSPAAKVMGTFTALDNTTWSYADVGPGPRVIELFGTWCPNCSDATALLVELQKEYGPRGVDFLAIGFELSGARDVDLQALNRYVEHHNIPYRVVLADQIDKEKNGARLPFLDKIRAYPTTIFVDGKGNVQAVHSGFSGPATGDAYAALVKRFRAQLDALVHP